VDGRRVVHDGYIGIVRVMGQASQSPCFAGAKARQQHYNSSTHTNTKVLQIRTQKAR
jgi:hypothetical protein